MTGVQTCALPIYQVAHLRAVQSSSAGCHRRPTDWLDRSAHRRPNPESRSSSCQRAACRKLDPAPSQVKRVGIVAPCLKAGLVTVNPEAMLRLRNETVARVKSCLGFIRSSIRVTSDGIEVRDGLLLRERLEGHELDLQDGRVIDEIEQ